MKLAWKELKYNKKKYLLVEMILVLMIFMVLFLSGLANGLGRAVSSAIDNVDAKNFIISEDSENLITISNLSTEDYEMIKDKTQNNVAVLNMQRMYILKSGEESKINLTYFAIDTESFILPKITEGTAFIDTDSENTIVLNDSFKEEGIIIGDIVEDSSTGIKMTVVGFTSDEMYGHTPVGFISTKTYIDIKKELNPNYQLEYNAIAVQGEGIEELNIDGLEVVDKGTIIENIPGYSAEQTTIKMILWVLVVISAAILGVFFYVITIQKEKQFGVLKAIGMEMKELTNFIVSQVIMLALIGVVFGNALAFGIASILPSSMPFYLKVSSACSISVIFILISILCSIISTRKVAKVDPMITIGGGNE